MSSWNGVVTVHGAPNTYYPQSPIITSNVTFGDIYRNGSTLTCNVSASLNAMTGKYSYFGYTLGVAASIDDGPLVEIYHKPTKPNKWSSGRYSGNVTVSTTNYGDTVTLKIWTKSTCGCPAKNTWEVVWSVVVGAPAYAPPNVWLSNTGCTASSLYWEAGSDVSCDIWMYNLDGTGDTTYWSQATTNGTWSLSNLSPTIHTVYLWAKRVNGPWGQSPTVTWDCRRPAINNAKITVTDNTSGILSLATDINSSVWFEGVYVGNTQNYRGTFNVNLSENTNRSYNITLQRLDNTRIDNSTTINCDTTYPIIKLTSVVEGLDIVYTAESDVPCRNWYLLLNDGTRIVNTTTTATTKCTFRVTGVPNVPISGTAYATKDSNNVTYHSNTVTNTPTGCARVFTEPTSVPTPAAVFVYDEKQQKWLSAVPYVYDNGQWKMCV